MNYLSAWKANVFPMRKCFVFTFIPPRYRTSSRIEMKKHSAQDVFPLTFIETTVQWKRKKGKANTWCSLQIENTLLFNGSVQIMHTNTISNMPHEPILQILITHKTNVTFNQKNTIIVIKERRRNAYNERKNITTKRIRSLTAFINIDYFFHFPFQ